jgi:putative lipoprotein
MPRRPSSSLSVAAVAIGLVALGHGRSARGEDTDAWLGRDKALHFAACGSLATVGYAGAAMVTTDRPARAAGGAGLGVGLGAAKELWDQGGHGDPSWKDFTWDLVGAATGVLFALAVDWTLHRAFALPDGAGR